MDTFEPHNVLFVYGALRRGQERARFLSQEKAKFLSPATVNGTLHAIGDIAGLVIDPSPSLTLGGVERNAPSSLSQAAPLPALPHANGGRVHGELFEIFDPKTFFDTLDVIEGYWPDQVERSLFVRKLIAVAVESSATTTAWAYVLNLSANGAAGFDSDE